MKPIDVKSSTYIDFWVENDDKDSKFEICDLVRISKYETNFVRSKKKLV